MDVEKETNKRLRRAFHELYHRDVRNCDTAREVGIDYVLKHLEIGPEKRCTVDDKGDTYIGTEPYRNNIALEIATFSAKERTLGWLIYGRPVALRYVSLATDDCFVLPMDEVRAFISPLMSKFPIGAAVNEDKKSKIVPVPFSHITLNLLVPWRTLLQECPGANVVRLSKGRSLLDGTEFVTRLVQPVEAFKRISYPKAKPYHISTRMADLTDEYLCESILRCNRFPKMLPYFRQCQLPANLRLPA